jgi:MoaA/NifB/PqqE/SkfB family radical SAM enzyme
MGFNSNTAPEPFDAVIAVTYRCNARCQMCNIWQVKDHDDCKPDDYRIIPDSLRHINVSGGEPFLRADLPDIVRVVSERNPKAHILVSSNGFQPSRTIESVRRMLQYHQNLGIGISIDGIGAMHDKVRGIPGAFEKSTETVRRLRDEVGLKDIRIAFTLQDDNVGHLLDVYELSKKLGTQFTWVVAQTSSHYFQNTDNSSGHWSGGTHVQGSVLELISRQLRSGKPKDWARAFFSHGNLLRAKNEPRPIRCKAASSFFFIGPRGDVHACNARNLPLGNIRTQSWNEIWTGKHADDVRDTVSRCTDNCWMVCTARSSMIEAIPEVVSWITYNKLRAHLGILAPLNLRLPPRAPGADVRGIQLPVLQA